MAFLSQAALQKQQQDPQQNGFMYSQTNPIPKGADRSFVEGYLAMKKNQRDGDENERANDTQGMKDTAFGWATEDRDRAEQLRQGMIMASKEGGYSGVIDFLKVNDPDKALKFESEKTDLDTKIMANETYKLAHADDKTKVMMQGYQLLGGIGATLMRAPPDQRADTYQHLLPIMKQVNPDMPDSLDAKAVSNLTLGMSLSTPANLLYNTQKQATQAQSQVGKLQADIDNRIARGETAENSPGLQNIMNQMSGENYKAKKAMFDVEDLKYSQQNMAIQNAKNVLSAQNAKQQLIGSITSNYEKRSKGFSDYVTTNMKVSAALDRLKNDPTDPTAQQTLQFSFAKMLAGGGVMSDQDVNRTATNSGAMGQAWKSIQSLGAGDKVILQPQEIANIKEMYGSIQGVYQKRQAETDTFYKNQLDKNGLPRDSIQFYQTAPPAALDILMKDPSQKNQQKFKQTFGYLPDMSAMGD